MNNNFVIDQVKVGDLFQQIHPNFETVRGRVWELSKIQNQEVYLECLDKEKLNSKWIRIDIFQKFYQQIY